MTSAIAQTRWSLPLRVITTVCLLCQVVRAEFSDLATTCGVDEIQLASDGTIWQQSLQLGQRFAPNTTLNGTVAMDEYAFYHLCIVRHEHEHLIQVNLTCFDGDANMFLSSEFRHPMRGQATWISQHQGDDFIKLYTYLDGFPRRTTDGSRSIPLHIGVMGETHATYNLSIAVMDLPMTSEILEREAFYTKRHFQDRKQHPVHPSAQSPPFGDPGT